MLMMIVRLLLLRVMMAVARTSKLEWNEARAPRLMLL